MAAAYYTLTDDDVGQPVIRAFGQTWMVSSFIGRVLPTDVGKRVYIHRLGGFLQVENDDQLAARLRPAHLRVEESPRGFARMPALPDDYGVDDAVEVYESSNAEVPSVWLKVKQTWKRDFVDRDREYTVEAHVHLSCETAWKLHEQLVALVENHYQGDARPERVRTYDEQGEPHDDVLRTTSGRVITEADILRWAEEDCEGHG